MALVHDFIIKEVVLTKGEAAKDREEKVVAIAMMEEREREENKINCSW